MPQSDEERLLVSLEARISDFEKKMAKAERRGTKTYQGLQRGSGRATRQMERDMTRSTARINQALASTSRQIGMLGRSFAGAFAGGIFAGGAAGFTRGVQSMISDMSELAKVIDRVGLSAQTFQELEFGFELAGVAQSEFRDGMERFNHVVGQAAIGTGVFKDILEANGVAIRDNSGEMRSVESLLRDYADLIKNASSEQERMTLAREAFGRGGASFVNALKNGADGFNDMADAAREAGGTIDEELLKRAEELDDEFAIAWRNFELNAKRAILGVMPVLQQLDDAAKSFLSNLPVARLGQYLFGGEEDPIDQRINDAFSGDMPGGNARLERELQKRYGNGRKTVLPGEDDGDGGGRARSRNAAAQAAIREREAVNALIDSLNHEFSLIGASDLEKAKANALRQAGSAATAEQRAQIENLITAIHNENAALDQQQQMYEDLGQIAQDAFSSLKTAMADGKLEGEELLSILGSVIQQLITMQSLGGGLGGGGAGSNFLGNVGEFKLKEA